MSLKEEKNAFQTDGNGTDDGDLGIRKTIINTYHVFLTQPSIHLSVWTSFLLYLMGYNLLLTLFILILKLYLIWPVGAPSNCYLCPFDMAQSFFEYFTF